MELHFPSGMQQQNLHQRLRDAFLKFRYRGDGIECSDQFVHGFRAEHAVEFCMPVHFGFQKCRRCRDFGVLQRAHVGQRIVVHSCRNSGAI